MSRPRRKPTRMEMYGATPGRLAVVGVLALVLMVVLVPQLFSERSDDFADQPQVQTENESQSIATPSATSASKPIARFSAETEWPPISLQAALAHNPFARPAWFDLPQQQPVRNALTNESVRADNREEQLAALRLMGTAMVMIVSGESVARLADRTLRVGDQYEGFLVTDITPRGVVLTEQTPPPPNGEKTYDNGL